MIKNDKLHLERLIEGSYEDYTILYNHYFSKLYGFIFSLTRSHSTTEEIVQETFIKIWTIREKIDPEGSFQAYIFKIAQNKLISSIRKLSSQKDFLNFLEISNTPEFSEKEIYEKLDYDDFLKKISSVKTTLTTQQLRVFELKIESGYNYDEIANILKINERTVQNQLSLALRTVRKQLKYLLLILLIFKNIL